MGYAVRVLVVGCGSIGKRHIGNLIELGVQEVIAVDVRGDRLEEVAKRHPDAKLFRDIDDAVATGPDAAVVAVPTAAHIPVALPLAEAGLPLMIEKPLAHNLDGVEKLEETLLRTGQWAMVAYSLRHHRCIELLRTLLREGVVGRVMSVRAECGQYLPDWHPWEDYKEWYMSSEDQGGGALLDLSHEIDYLRWFFGEVTHAAGTVVRVSDLDITSDDLSELILEFESGIVASVHLDLLQRVYRRTCLIIGSEGTLEWSHERSSVRCYRADRREWEELTCSEEKNSYFQRELRNFLECVKGASRPLVDLSDGRRTLEVVLAAKRASRERRWVRVSDDKLGS